MCYVKLVQINDTSALFPEVGVSMPNLSLAIKSLVYQADKKELFIFYGCDQFCHKPFFKSAIIQLSSRFYYYYYGTFCCAPPF